MKAPTCQSSPLKGGPELVGPSRRDWLWILFSFFICCGLSIEDAFALEIIDFEESVADDDHQQAYPADGPPYVEDGFLVRASGNTPQLLANNPAQDNIGNGPDGGSKHMSALAPLIPGGGFQGSSILIERTDASLFSVIELDVSEYSSVFDVPLNLQFVGVSTGGIVTQYFVTDGVNDGAGPLNDFEHLVLDPIFTQLSSFEILGLPGARSGLLAVDNITVDNIRPVAEPSSYLLVGFGLAILVAMKNFPSRRKV